MDYALSGKFEIGSIYQETWDAYLMFHLKFMKTISTIFFSSSFCL